MNNQTLKGLMASLFMFMCALLLPSVALSQSNPYLSQSNPYQGTTVRFLTSRNVHQTALAEKMAKIAQQWGINFEVRYLTTDQLARKVVLDHIGGADTWDLVYTGGIQRMYEWYNAWDY